MYVLLEIAGKNCQAANPKFDLIIMRSEPDTKEAQKRRKIPHTCCWAYTGRDYESKKEGQAYVVFGFSVL